MRYYVTMNDVHENRYVLRLSFITIYYYNMTLMLHVDITW